MELKEMIDEFDKFQTELTSTIEKQSEEIQQSGVTTKETADKVKELEGNLQSIGEGLKEAQERAKEQDDLLTDLQKKFNRPGFDEHGRRKSLGEQFISSEEYKEYKENGGQIKSRRWETGSLFRPDGSRVKQKDLDSSDESAGATIFSQRLEGIIAPPDRALRIRDLINVSPTSTNAIEYVIEKGFTNNAAMVAEKGTKPQSNITFERKSTMVETLAHWIPATRQVLNDSSQLRSYIDGRLIFGLKLTEEQQILYGNGASPQLQGILTHDDIQQYRWSQGEVGDTRIDAIRRALTLSRLAEFPVSGIVLHPSDWEKIELQKDDDSRYIWVTVPEGGETRLWRVPVIDTTAINEGEALVGGFSLGATLWDREESNIRVSEDHDDFFIKNQVAVLAEERIALTVFRPEAFVAVDFDNTPVDS